MSFKLDDIIVDRIQMGYAEVDDKLLYTLTQLSDATIEVTAESKDAVDANGTLIKRFWQSKSGSFTATNAMLNLNVIAAASGSEKQVSGADNAIVMPKVVTVKNTTGASVDITGYVDGTLRVNALGGNGALGDEYKKGTTASATEYAVSTSGSKTTLLLPTVATSEVIQFVVAYDRTVTTDGIYIANSADKFPGTVKLTLKALVVDPCDADTLRAAYIVMPSFQVSPEISISLTTDGTLDYKGDLQIDFCDTDKSLYQIYVCYDDEE